MINRPFFQNFRLQRLAHNLIWLLNLIYFKSKILLCHALSRDLFQFPGIICWVSSQPKFVWWGSPSPAPVLASYQPAPSPSTFPLHGAWQYTVVMSQAGIQSTICEMTATPSRAGRPLHPSRPVAIRLLDFTRSARRAAAGSQWFLRLRFTDWTSNYPT